MDHHNFVLWNSIGYFICFHYRISYFVAWNAYYLLLLHIAVDFMRVSMSSIYYIMLACLHIHTILVNSCIFSFYGRGGTTCIRYLRFCCSNNRCNYYHCDLAA